MALFKCLDVMTVLHFLLLTESKNLIHAKCIDLNVHPCLQY